MYNIYMKVPNEIKTKLDSMTLLDRFLFNETVEDVQTYNDMIEILLDDQVHLICLGMGYIAIHSRNSVRKFRD